ncbi:MAG: hypothetical protein ABEJ72_00945 [Candidatus Aenigmatarchaeota archaeon]
MFVPYHPALEEISEANTETGPRSPGSYIEVEVDEILNTDNGQEARNYIDVAPHDLVRSGCRKSPQ